ncbi:MAG: extracellular solute-binding protein [Planctomycetes bacterium]|nr:extracellular solute-binding protein [Planctomycetota bacterium]
MTFRIVIFLALALVLGVPFAMRPAEERGAQVSTANTLVVVTPHVPQIQFEFARAFARWHERHYHEPARIDWRQPGGTSEIIKQLEAQYLAAAKAGRFDFSNPKNPTCPAGTVGYDAMLGGGTYDHGRLKTGITFKPDTGQDVRIPMSMPAGFTQEQLDAWYGKNELGACTLYDPEQYWLGTALSGFGIVFNKPLLARLHVKEPTSFEDLANPALRGWVVFADPRQSGSIATTLDAILSFYGWDKGWKLLRESCANARYFSNSAPRPPIDVSQGEAAIGLAIDFYGRGQSQAVLAPHQDPSESRVGYIDPKGSVYIDADPISLLRGGPNPALAKRFAEFCLTDEAQALWQFPAATDPRGSTNPKGESGEPLGPERNNLRRMPARRAMYEKYRQHFIDQADPFELASKTKPAGWRGTIGIMMGAFAIDVQEDMQHAWAALLAARANPNFPKDTLARMESLFYSWPTTTLADGKQLPFTPENVKAIAAAWKDPMFKARCEIQYTEFFRAQYRAVTALAKSN